MWTLSWQFKTHDIHFIIASDLWAHLLLSLQKPGFILPLSLIDMLKLNHEKFKSLYINSVLVLNFQFIVSFFCLIIIFLFINVQSLYLAHNSHFHLQIAVSIHELDRSWSTADMVSFFPKKMDQLRVFFGTTAVYDVAQLRTTFFFTWKGLSGSGRVGKGYIWIKNNHPVQHFCIF